MKKSIQTNVRKVYGSSVQQQQQQTEIQMNAVRKINSLLSTGAVSVTGPTQPRILKQKPQIFNINSQTQKCYVCDEVCSGNGTILLDTVTTHSHTKLPNKIGRLIGEAFLVIVRADDVVCKRCVNLFNRMDNLETELERIRNNVLTFICKKYGIMEEEIRSGGGSGINSGQPPAKLQKITTPGGTTATKVVTRVLTTAADHDDEDTPVRKLIRSGDDVFENAEVRTMPALVRTTTTNSSGSNATQVRKLITGQTSQQTVTAREPIKIYRCATCDHTTPDLKQFQAHYDTCRSTWPCKLCRKVFTSSSALKQHTTEKHPHDYTCHFCNLNFLNDVAYKKHLEASHPDVKIVETTATATSVAPVVSQTQATNIRTGVIYTCNLCQFKTGERQTYEDHMRKHNKMKPFKCRICNMRFETRESASKHAKTHQPDYFKCGDCAASFPQRELLMKHFETHHKAGGGIQTTATTQKVVVTTNSTSGNQTSQSVTTQKLLQETIDEALRDSGDALDTSKGIHFFSCNICSLTFIQENYYNQHMETHKRDTKKVTTAVSSSAVSSANAAAVSTSAQRQSLIRQDVRSTNATILGTQTTTISDADLESIFEKMHADKGENEAVSAVQTTTSDNLVITKQSTASGGITYNITIPQQQQDGGGAVQGADGAKVIFQTNEGEGGQMAAGIDMPVLDNLEEGAEGSGQAQGEGQQQEATEVGGGAVGEGNGDGVVPGPPVSMPSLDDDADSQSQSANIDAVPMELDEMQSGVEGEQIKFILNENGQLLQLDNHIITTDAEGNQIIVQGADSEHLQQLLQSVAGLDGTIQMIGENNQMILVQQGDSEPQLIDASLLNADGHIVIQQAQDGESQSSEDVGASVAYASAASAGEDSVPEQGGDESVVQHQQTDGEEQQEVSAHHHGGEQPMETEEEEVAKEESEATTEQHQEQIKEGGEQEDGEKEESATAAAVTEAETPVTSGQTTTTSEVFFNIDDLMGHPETEQK